ncbi:hypothetical protein [Halobacillus amylolyticus]|uniref:Uncharacterized protein n=1 Tax=Halobacillus amylolyticus TaxID=2932259 RepID=A0ABY4HF11_9BACI|nr:hypothetical protein [Halobacillus amylolyticus]UOR12495.1 hypothetical protein MUO15_02970 [Halobacillus amylolyticus]
MDKQQPVVSMAMYEEQLQLLQEKFSLMEKRISLKADEVVFTMSISHRKEIDQLKDEVIHLREQLSEVKKEQQEIYVKKFAGAARRRSVG